MSKSNEFSWPGNVSFTEKAEEDLAGFDHSQQIQIFKAIIKVAQNPFPRPKGYGKPLGKDLSGYMKIKLLESGIRIIYRLVPPSSDCMQIVIIGMRSDDEVYSEIQRRI